MSNTDKMGILVALAVTAGAIVFVANVSTTNDSSMQLQGELVIERAALEITEIPENTKEFVDESIETIEESVDEIEDVIDTAESATQEIEEVLEDIENTIPEVPNVVKQSTNDKFLAKVTIPPGTYVPGCEDSNVCYLPSQPKISSGGEVIWTNNDSVMHTVTSGNARDGPNGLFDSQLIEPFESYSLDFGISGEYEYFCMVHPWMRGTVIVS